MLGQQPLNAARFDQTSVSRLGKSLTFHQERKTMPKKQETTVHIDHAVPQAIKVVAARTGRNEDEIVNDALRTYLGLDAVGSVWRRSTLTDDEALDLAYVEPHAMRRERGAE